MPTGASSFLLGGNAALASACLHRHRERSGRLRRNVPFRGVSCHQQGGADDDGRQGTIQPRLDRRDLLIGLGGLYGAAARGPMALANPVTLPDLTKCHDSNAAANKHCCPPFTGTETIVDYDFPSTPLRVRRPAHEVINDEDYMRKYTLAVKRMKALPEDDPWNYLQQANVHCQYCNDAYTQTGSDAAVQVHYSWFFLPWHRFYLHFYERILGKLIGDDTFTLPFWNFDAAEGMTFPRIFEVASSSLYNPKRQQDHVKEGVLFDYRYSYGNTGGSGLDGNELIEANLDYMKKTFQQSLALPELFMGDPLRGDEQSQNRSNGQLEVIHNAAHMWVGPTESSENCPDGVAATSCHVDMGDFSTAARDSVFFCLHANVDRLWDVYRHFRGSRVEFEDTDWLDSEFLFTDENRKLVKVKIRDSLDPSKLCYTYQQVQLPWLAKKITKKDETTDTATSELSLTKVSEFPSQPQQLDAQKPLRVLVARPKKNRKKKEKKEAVEVLQVKDIEVSLTETVRFDVYVATPYGNLAGPGLGEFAGSFVRLAHAMSGDMPKQKAKKGALKLGLNELLEDIEAEDADKLVVSLVLRTGEVSVGGVNIKLLETETSGFF